MTFTARSPAFPRAARAPRSPRHIALAAAILTLATTLAGAAPAPKEEHVGIYAEKGDPMRWSVPADTPRLKYEAEAKGSRAALAEALKECRALAADGAACASRAQSQFREDMELARALLAKESPSGLSPKGTP